MDKRRCCKRKAVSGFLTVCTLKLRTFVEREKYINNNERYPATGANVWGAVGVCNADFTDATRRRCCVRARPYSRVVIYFQQVNLCGSKKQHYDVNQKCSKQCLETGRTRAHGEGNDFSRLWSFPCCPVVIVLLF